MNLNLIVLTQLIAIACVIVFVSWWSVGRLIKFLISKDIVDRPNHRTLHQGAVPRGGGLVIIAGLLLALAVAAAFDDRPILFAALGLFVFAWSALSWYDDRSNLSPRFRLLVQVGICLLSIFAFGWVSHVHSPGSFSLPLYFLGPVLSIIGLVWMANLYNFMDGLDGLAASQTIVASLSMAFWFYMFGDISLALVLISLASLTYGFLLWNWNPARVFMGDVGSIGLGAFFGLIFILGVTRYDVSILSFFSLFAVFIADSTSTIIMRALKREKIWQPHRQHFYQRLATAGYSHAKIAIAALVLMILCSLLATFGLLYHDMIGVSIMAIVILLIAAAVLVVFLEHRSSNRPSA